MCTKLTLPSWIRSLPKPDAVKEEWEEFMISCAEATLSDTACDDRGKLTVLQYQWPNGRIAEGLCPSTLLPALLAPLSR